MHVLVHPSSELPGISLSPTLFGLVFLYPTFNPHPSTPSPRAPRKPTDPFDFPTLIFPSNQGAGTRGWGWERLPHSPLRPMPPRVCISDISTLKWRPGESTRRANLCIPRRSRCYMCPSTFPFPGPDQRFTFSQSFSFASSPIPPHANVSTPVAAASEAHISWRLVMPRSASTPRRVAARQSSESQPIVVRHSTSIFLKRAKVPPWKRALRKFFLKASSFRLCTGEGITRSIGRWNRRKGSGGNKKRKRRKPQAPGGFGIFFLLGRV